MGGRGGRARQTKEQNNGLAMTSQQSDKINSFKKNILKIKEAIPQSLTFSQGDNGRINYSYQTKQIVVDVHAGKMPDPMKDKMYERTYTKTGYISPAGTVGRNTPTHHDVFLGTRKQLYKQSKNGKQ